MRKLISLICLVLFVFISNSQTLYSTYQHVPKGTGVVLEFTKYKVNPVLGIDLGVASITKYVFTDNPIKGKVHQTKVSLGTSIVVTNDVNLLILGNYNYIFKITHPEFFRFDRMKKVSFSLGFTLKFTHNTKFIMSYDILNKEPKVGIGININ